MVRRVEQALLVAQGFDLVLQQPAVGLLRLARWLDRHCPRAEASAVLVNACGRQASPAAKMRGLLVRRSSACNVVMGNAGHFQSQPLHRGHVEDAGRDLANQGGRPVVGADHRDVFAPAHQANDLDAAIQVDVGAVVRQRVRDHLRRVALFPGQEQRFAVAEEGAQPIRAMACASSQPSGPPPMTSSLGGSPVSSKTDSFIKKPAAARPSMSGTSGRDPVAMMALLKRKRRPSTSTASWPA